MWNALHRLACCMLSPSVWCYSEDGGAFGGGVWLADTVIRGGLQKIYTPWFYPEISASWLATTWKPTTIGSHCKEGGAPPGPPGMMDCTPWNCEPQQNLSLSCCFCWLLWLLRWEKNWYKGWLWPYKTIRKHFLSMIKSFIKINLYYSFLSFLITFTGWPESHLGKRYLIWLSYRC